MQVSEDKFFWPHCQEELKRGSKRGNPPVLTSSLGNFLDIQAPLMQPWAGALIRSSCVLRVTDDARTNSVLCTWWGWGSYCLLMQHTICFLKGWSKSIGMWQIRRRKLLLLSFKFFSPAGFLLSLVAPTHPFTLILVYPVGYTTKLVP